MIVAITRGEVSIVTDTFREVLEEARELVRAAAHPRRGTIAVSPEVKALIEAASSPQTAPAQASPASEAHTR